MKKITIVKSESFVCNFCLKRHCKLEVKADTYSSTMFCLCESCAKKLNDELSKAINQLSENKGK